MRMLPAFCLLLLAPAAFADQVELNGRTFNVHEGFELSVVTTTELTQRPINAALDEQGRLYVSESSGSNEPTKVQLEKKPHSILRLEDTDGDGAFDRRTVYATGMMFPEGTLWYEGSLYVAAPPQIWKLTDTTGDGRADQREVWFDGKTLTGCANDLHGPYLGRDGRIYWCKGAFAEQTYNRPGREPFVTRASHIFRARPDGTEIEHVMTGGMDNPVDVAFSPTGERFFTTTFLQHPSGGRRDGIIHAAYGGVYGKHHSVLHGHARTGPLMPPLIHLGAAAPSGLDSVDLSGLFGAAGAPAADCALVASQFNKHRISLHLLKEQGATYASTDLDLVVCGHPDFHPTDVFQDADGSLLIVDTGGWYKLCCPTSQLVKPDVPGAIYRLRAKRPRTSAGDVQWSDRTDEQLVDLLAHDRPYVVERALRTLAKRGPAAVTALRQKLRVGSVAARQNVLWALARIDDKAARTAVRISLAREEEPRVRRTAAHVAGLYRDAEALPFLLKDLVSPDPHLARAAAEAVGRMESGDAVQALLFASGREDNSDRVLQHARTYALIEIGDAKQTTHGLKSTNPGTQRAALLALDQMSEGGLEANEAIRRLVADDHELRETAEWIAVRHDDWSGELAAWAARRVQNDNELPAGVLRTIAASPRGQDLLLNIAEDTSASQEGRRRCFAVLGMLPSNQFSAESRKRLCRLSNLSGPLLGWLTRAIAASVEPKAPDADCVAALRELALRDELQVADRLTAIASAVHGLKPLPDDLFSILVDQIDAANDVSLRTRSAGVLAAARLTLTQRAAVARRFTSAGLPEASGLLRVFEKQKDADLGRLLVKTLAESDALAGIHPGQLKEALRNFPDAVRERAKPLFAELQIDFEGQQARLAQLEAELPKGDIRRGQEVFLGTKAGCYSCHEIGYLGGDIGPDLTRIGRIRTKRDLLEAIVYPSASLVRSYEPVSVLTDSGQTHSGLLRRKANGDLIVVKDPTTEVTVSEDAVEQIVPSNVSVMPKGVDQLLTRQQLADLIEFLATRK